MQEWAYELRKQSNGDWQVTFDGNRVGYVWKGEIGGRWFHSDIDGNHTGYGTRDLAVQCLIDLHLERMRRSA